MRDTFSFAIWSRVWRQGAVLAALSLMMPGAHAQKADNTLRIGTAEPLSSLDYYMGAERTNIIMSRMLFDCLLYKDPDTGKIVPALATSYRFVDPTTIAFTIRQGVTFQDGTPMTADDVVYTLNTVSDPKYGALYQIAVNWIKSAEKTGPWTVVLHMKKTYPASLEWLAGFIPIYPEAYYKKVGPSGMAVKPIGTGPYMLDSMQPGSHWVLKKNPNYWKGSPDHPSLSTIDLRIMPETNTQINELVSNKLDFIWNFTPDIAAKLKRFKNIDVKQGPTLRIVYALVNPHLDTPIKDIRVRQAIIYAINREAIKNAFVGPAAQVINAACDPTQFGCIKDVESYSYDVQKAKALLTQAGYPNGFTLNLLVGAGAPTARPVQEAIMQDLGKVGIKLNITEKPWAAANDDWKAGKFPLMLMSWGAWGIGDVAMTTSQFFRGDAVDQVKDPEIVAAIMAGDTETDRAKRADDYAQALKRIAAQADFVPLWNYTVNYAQSKDLNFTVQPDEIARFYNAVWK